MVTVRDEEIISLDLNSHVKSYLGTTRSDEKFPRSDFT